MTDPTTTPALAEVDYMPPVTGPRILEVAPLRGFALYDALVLDARRQLADAQGQDELFRTGGQRAARWRNLNPGLNALLDQANGGA